MSHLPEVHKATIPGEVRSGTCITLEGKVNSDTTRFDIELKGNQDGGDVPLHSSFRFNEGCVVRNHMSTAYGWGDEEREGGMHLFPGQNFNLQFKINSDDIVVSVDGSHFYNFKHRLPMNSISCVVVFGGVTISSVEFC